MLGTLRLIPPCLFSAEWCFLLASYPFYAKLKELLSLQEAYKEKDPWLLPVTKDAVTPEKSDNSIVKTKEQKTISQKNKTNTSSQKKSKSGKYAQ